MKKVFVTKPFLPSVELFKSYVDRIWENGQLTNHGPFLSELETQLKAYLGVQNFAFVTNGTLALQLAMRALGITEGDIITTPFSYVATTSSILWERCNPVFVDIDPNNFCIDANKIEAAITKDTKAIMAVHVFGYPCDVDKIAAIAAKHNLKVIYDAAHAFGVTYKGKSLLDYGDISTCSFHATKLFQTIEGGGVVTKNKEMLDRINLIKSFGHVGDEHFCLGMNAKASEFQAIMGLSVLPEIENILAARQKICESYDSLLGGVVQRPQSPDSFKYNYSYYPVVLPDEKICLKVIADLNAEQIYPRRYFYPSLNTLPYLKARQSCPVSEDIASRILCLPLYVGLEDEAIRRIASIVKSHAIQKAA